MEPLTVQTVICGSCGADQPPSAAVCSQCGHALASPAGADRPAPGISGIQRVIDQPGLMLLILFGAAMILGVPWLWQSRGFSRRGKLVYTVLVTVYTIVVFWLFWLVMSWSIASIRRSLGL